jgi:uncharacterized protein YkwD
MTTRAQPRTGTAKRFRGSLPVALALLLLGLCFAPAAPAEFVAAPLPPGWTSIRTLAVLDGATWAAHEVPATGPQRVSVTSDRGATWTDVAGLLSAGDTIAGLAAAPGRTYRAVISLTGTAARVQVKSITQAGTVTDLGAPFARSIMSTGSVAVDDDGTTWVPHWFAFSDPDTWGAVRVTASGQVTDFAGPTGDPSAVNAVRTVDGLRIHARGVGSFRVEGTSLVLDGPEPVLLRDGQLVFRTSTTSYDGGAHFVPNPFRQVVRGAPGQPAVTHLRIGQRIATRFDARQFRAAPPLLSAFGAIVSTGAAFVALSPSAILVNDGDLPPWPTSIGALAPDSVAMLERANLLRADAGLPPLIGDATLAQAARNHANYDKQWDEGHAETPGRAGFTGQGPGQRCAFVGTSCNQEVMHYGLSAANAVDGWVATPFHRPALLSPRAGIVGPAQSAGTGPTSVMDSGENLQELVAAVGYPSGTYRGPLAFYGESPDPAVACAAGGQPVTYPLGAAVTLFAPGAATMIGVREVGGGALAGCVLGDVFLPDNPLVAGRSYEASGSWDLGGGARRAESWSFTAKPDAPGPGPGLILPPFPFTVLPPPAAPPVVRDSTRPLLSMSAMSPLRFRAAARGSSIVTRGSSRVAFTLSERATVRFEVERRVAGRRVGGRCASTTGANRRAPSCTRYVRQRGAFSFSAKSGRNAIRFSGRLGGRKLSAGRYRLRAVATDAARNASSPRRSRVFSIVRR